MSMELTLNSEQEYSNILYGQMTPEIAAEYLRDQRIFLRSFSDTLKKLYPADDLRKRLTDFYMITQPSANYASIDKKIRNWLSDKNQPTDREDLYRIAFALGLNEGSLDYLLGLCSDYGIQYRNGRELVLTWFLKNGYGYREAIELFDSLPESPGLEQVESGVTSHITHAIHSDFQSIHSLVALTEYYKKNVGLFGKLHIRSYYYFDKFFGQLVHPTTPLGLKEEDYSIDAVMNTYLSFKIPSSRSRTSYTLVQKLIKNNWPNTTAIKLIRSHSADVPRKLLLILYIATENCIMSDQYSEYDEDYANPEDRFSDHWYTVNTMLSDCGMAQLDPRNAFDWLVLYSIAADPDEAMSDRLEEVISALYDS